MTIYIKIFNARFADLHRRSVELIRLVPDEKLFWKPRDLGRTMAMFSVGEFVLRSAGKVEQTFGGITTRLWDDPFEWTLPEKLATGDLISEYLAEVEATRLNGFNLLKSDEDLRREIPAPAKMKTIFEILLETIARAEHFQGRAFAVFQMFSDDKPPKF
ncbi:MAG: hypothetical protein LH472_16225 [Pyrinomonadaceae bacterium]|nr:hypothetical protein [Pyrinomonadaceae bacterium]